MIAVKEIAVKEAEALVAAARERLTAAEEVLREAVIESCPIKFGEIYTRTIQRGFGRKAKTISQRAQVTGFATRWGRTSPVGTLFIADGTLGKRKIEIDLRWGSKWVKEDHAA